MKSTKLKKAVIKSLPYIIIGLLFTNLGEAWRISTGADIGERLLSFFSAVGIAFSNPAPSFHPVDLYPR